MFKWMAGLLLGLYLVLQLGGQDPRQLRPGLASTGVDETAATAAAPAVEVQTLSAADQPQVTAGAVKTTSSAATRPAEPPRTESDPTPPAEVVATTYSPEPAPVTLPSQADKVFTLSALPGQIETPREAEIDTPTDSQAQVTPRDAEVWYVTGRSVNVRQGPSTDAPVVGKLLLGDAALVLGDTGLGWVQVTVEGDGVTGYVSSDYLSPVAP